MRAERQWVVQDDPNAHLWRVVTGIVAFAGIMGLVASSFGWLFTHRSSGRIASREIATVASPGKPAKAPPVAIKPPQPEQLAKHQYFASSRGRTVSGEAVKPEALAKSPEAAMAEPPTTALETPEPMESYTIVAGDSLRSIAARSYGSERQWHRITKANPRLDPRRLRVGQVIKLPGPFSAN